MTDPRAINHDLVLRRHVDVLRLFVGRGQRFGVETLAEATRLPARTLKSYRDGQSLPGLSAFVAMAAALPAAYANEVLAPAGLAGAFRIEADAPSPHAILAEKAEMVRALATALADGRIDHREGAEMLPELRQFLSDLASFIQELSEIQSNREGAR